jgi:hypothetical protein
LATEAIKRGMVATISQRSVGRFLNTDFHEIDNRQN